MERQTSNRLASTVGRRNPFLSLSLTTSGWRKIPPLSGVSVPTSAALPPSACSRYAITGEAANAEELAPACETAADEAEPVVWRLRPSNSPRRGGTGSERGSRPLEARRKEPRNRRPRPPRADTGVTRRGGGELGTRISSVVDSRISQEVKEHVRRRRGPASFTSALFPGRRAPPKLRSPPATGGALSGSGGQGHRHYPRVVRSLHLGSSPR